MKRINLLIVVISMIVMFCTPVFAGTLIASGTYIYDEDMDELIVTIDKANFDVGNGCFVLNMEVLEFTEGVVTENWRTPSSHKSESECRTWECMKSEYGVTTTISLTFDLNTGIEGGGDIFISLTGDVSDFLGNDCLKTY